MRLLIGPAADFSSLLHINHFVFATKNQRLIFIRNRKLNILFKIEEKKENLSENYGLDMNRDLGKEIDAMCNFSDLIEERGIQQGLDYGIKTTIEACKGFGSSYDKAKSFIIEKYQLSTAEAEIKMQEYWNN